VFDDLERYMKKVVLLAIIGAVVLMILTFLLGISIARAHSWYEPECCDTRDCEPIPPDQVKVTPEGYIAQMTDARKAAALLKVHLEFIRMQHSEQQSAEASKRAEMRL